VPDETRHTPEEHERLELVVDEVSGRDGPSVVLLHGLTQQRKFWMPVMKRLMSDPAHPRIIAVDLRGHGESARPEGGYGVASCAADVVAVMESLSLEHSVVVGHSWGASVALSVAAARHDLVSAVVALDGGFVRLSDLGDREQVRERLLPPRLGIPLDELMASISSGLLAPWWSDEVRDALLPTFEVGDDGLARTRLGYERHLMVLDGLLDFEPEEVLPKILCPAWLIQCEPLPNPDDPYASSEWQQMGENSLQAAVAMLVQARVQRWAGALHDVPLQWPWLVAGLIRACVAEVSRPSQGSRKQ